MDRANSTLRFCALSQPVRGVLHLGPRLLKAPAVSPSPNEIQCEPLDFDETPSFSASAPLESQFLPPTKTYAPWGHQVMQPMAFGPDRSPRVANIESLYSQTGRIPHAEILERAKAVLSSGLPSAAALVNRYRGKLIIAGGGPSLTETLPDIRRQLRLSKNTRVAAVNKTHDWLIAKTLKPDFGILIDPKPWVSRYMTPTRGVKYCIGAKVDKLTWQRFRGQPEVYHWHPLELAREKELISTGTDWIAVPGQSTVGLRTVPLGYCFGFRKFELHGMDCNKRDGKNHAYQKFSAEDMAKHNPTSDLGNEIFYLRAPNASLRVYEGTTHMARQLGEFRTMITEFLELERRGQEPCEIKVAGNSAMGYLAAIMGLHVNDDYNENPNIMPQTGCLDPNLLESAA